MALKQITTTGTNLNTTMTADLQTASNLYNKEISPAASSSLIGNIIDIVGNTVKVSVQALLKALMSVVGVAVDLVGSVKDAILGFIFALVGRDTGNLSKLSLQEKSNLGKQKNADCNFDLGGFGFGGFNLSILGYSIAALLAMLLCKGITGIFSILGTIVDLGIATVSVVAGAVSDVFSNIFGNSTAGIVKDLADSPYGPKISSNVNNSENMIFNVLKKDTTAINANTLVSGGSMSNGSLINSTDSKYKSMSDSLDTLTPNWLSNGQEFSLGKIRGNDTISGIASQDLKSKASSPLLNSNDYTGKVLNSQEKISLLSMFS